MIFDDFKTLVETFHGMSLHLNSYLVLATPIFFCKWDVFDDLFHIFGFGVGVTLIKVVVL